MSPGRSAAPRRAAAGNAALLAGATLAALALLELGLRVLPIGDPTMLPAFTNPPVESWWDAAWGNPGGDAYRPEPTLGYEHAPDVDQIVPLAARPDGAFRFRTNDRGLRRDAATALAKPAATRRVLVLGDSHTAGYVDNAESFATLLEARLADRGGAGTAVEVLNAGVVGYSPAQAYLWYALRGVALDPDVVVLVLYVGNDVAELADPTKPGLDPATGEAVPALAGGVGAPGRFGSRDRLDALRVVAWTRAAIRFGPLAPLWRRLDLPGATREIGDVRAETLAAALRTCHGCFWQSLQQAARAARHPHRTRADLARLAAIATRLEREVRARGGRLVVALLPTRAQVEPEPARAEQRPVAALLGLAAPSLAFEDEVEGTLAARLGDAGVTVVRLLDPLRAAAASGAQYYPRDWHLAPGGHRTVADALAGTIVKSLHSDPVHASR